MELEVWVATKDGKPLMPHLRDATKETSRTLCGRKITYRWYMPAFQNWRELTEGNCCANCIYSRNSRIRKSWN